MRVKKPQSKDTGGNLAKSLKPKVKNLVKKNLTTKQNLLGKSSKATTTTTTSTKKSIPSSANLKKSLTKVALSGTKAQTEKIDKNSSNSNTKAAKQKDDEKNETKSKPLNKIEKIEQEKEKERKKEKEKTVSMGSNATKEKAATSKKAKTDKKTSATTSNSNSTSTSAPTPTPASALSNEKKTSANKDEKISVFKSSKELKNLDIQLTGYTSVTGSTANDSDSDKVINASICEIVKTKARAASSTFNSSGNRSPLLTANSPGPSATKLIPKTNAEHKSNNKSDSTSKVNKDDGSSKKIAIEKTEKTVKTDKMEKIETPKNQKSAKANKIEQKQEKKVNAPSSTPKKSNVKMEKDEKLVINKTANKAPKKKVTKPVQSIESDEMAQTTSLPIEKSIEIKAQVDDSNSLIDSITEVINEVVKHYNDSNSSAVITNPGNKSIKEQNSDDKPMPTNDKSVKSTNTKSQTQSDAPNKKKKIVKSTATENKKVSKPSGKKLLNQKKLNILHETADLVIDKKNAMEIVEKKAKIKKQKQKATEQKTKEVENEDRKEKEGEKEKETEKEKEKEKQSSSEKDAIDRNAGEKHENENNEEKLKKSENKQTKVNITINKTGTGSTVGDKAKTKVNNKTSAAKKAPVPEKPVLKGSKIIKIALKNKKKAKPAGAIKNNLMKPIKKALTTKKDSNSPVKKTETDSSAPINDFVECVQNEKPKGKPDDMSEDDDLSLNELKAQLSTKSDTAPSTSKSVSPAAKPNAQQAKAAVKSSLTGSTLKDKQLKKPIFIKTVQKKVMKPLRKDIKPDVYDFHESGHSSEDAFYVHKKNRAELNAEAKKKGNSSKVVDESKGKPEIDDDAKKVIKKKNETLDKDTKNDTKSKPQPKAKEKAKPKPKPKAKPKVNKTKNDDNSSDSDNDNDNDNDAIRKKTSANQKSNTDTDSSASGRESAKKGKKPLPKTRAAIIKRKLAAKNRRMKLFGFYSGPKRHRMASLNALAKVQCLYENESRTAQELGFVKEPQTVQRMKIVSEADRNVDHPGKVQTEEKKQQEIDKKEKKEKKEKKSKPDIDTDKLKNDKDENATSDRTLRKVPGGRGEGSLWEMDSSLDESDRDDNEMQKPLKQKLKKKPLPKKLQSPPKKPLPTSKEDSMKSPVKKSKPMPSKMKKAKVIKKSPSSNESSSDNDKSDHESTMPPSPVESKPVAKKFKKQMIEKIANTKTTEVKEVVVRKRMASLNASAMMAATYEVERHLDKCEAKMYKQSAETTEMITVPKKSKEIKDEVVESKDSKPVSTNVVIVQDTDVTITGVYVNSTLGSSQEAYCKMQYRVQSSVTEERLVRPTPQEPPKSYTPLNALSSMLPPGNESGIPDAHQLRVAASTAGLQTLPIQTPPNCESPYRYSSIYPPTPHQGPIHQHLLQPPPPAPSIHHSSSAFCPLPPQAHHEPPPGYYQPAGPLINSHLVGAPQNLTKQPIASPLDPELQSSSQQSTSDGGDLSRAPHSFRYQSGPPVVSSQAGPPPSQLIPSAAPLPNHYSRPLHQMHCPTYSPAPYYTYGQHPRDMCYSPPYQSGYYTPKVYSTAYRPYMPSTSYYQTAPAELYEHPSSMHQQSVVPPPPQSVAQQQPPQSQTISTANQPPIQPQPQQMQSPNTQLVPAAQHMEHYSPYYAPGYSHPGGQCFTPPFMDSSPYPSSCPCPIQPYPKNVHIGPLIGSQSDKGPSQKNASIQNNKNNIKNSNGNSNNNLAKSSVNKKVQIQCKTENISDDSTLDTIVKPEIICSPPIMHSFESLHSDVTAPSDKSDLDRSYEKLALVPQHHPNFTVNSKLLEEPEMSISPARGSIGPGVAKMQASASQPLDGIKLKPETNAERPNSPTDQCLNAQTPISGRRARVGKTMAREMIFPSYTNLTNSSIRECSNELETKARIFSSTPIKTQTSVEESVKIPHFMSGTVNGRLIKQENLKRESDDDVMIISDKSESESNSVDLDKPTNSYTIDLSEDKVNDSTANTSRKRCNSDADEIIDLDEDSSVANVKRRKIMEFQKNPSKKSPPNSYKSLIKPSETKSYLCKADTPTKPAMLSINMTNGKRVSDTEIERVNQSGHNELMTSCDRISEIVIDDSSDQNTIDDSSSDVNIITSTSCTTQLNVDSIAPTHPFIADEFPHELTTEKENFMSNLDLTNDNIAKGYCSDNEVLSRKQERLKNKLKTCEGRSRSETKRADKTPRNKSMDETISAATDERSKSKSDKRSRDRSTSSTSTKSKTESKQQTGTTTTTPSAPLKKVSSNPTNGKTKNAKSSKTKETEEKYEKEPKPTKKSKETKAKTKRDDSKNRSIASQSSINDDDSHVDNESLHSDVTLLDNETHSNNNNNNNNNNSILMDKNNKYHFNALDDEDDDELMQQRPTAKKSKSRGSKFSNKKRHRARQTKHVEEVIIPRRASAVPRWSNGWNWEGEPFQGKVFLNSDDHQVVRTRYPAMRHDCGDVIKPGDCVLLRAGSKKNELPYVAKVASLWENPEDGEMMMSLLWYYRPEHTEQGRQSHDCMDEVFASKHQDHNSVACIEDKCYVLTFNEYCRYRKTIRAIEQGIEEVPSIVPALKYTTGREVPLNTNSELILFCRRVYEFRLRRLIKNPT